MIEIDGWEDVVLDEGSRLLGMVADDLQGARLLNLRLEYDAESAPGQVVGPATGMLDVMTAAADSSKEAAPWRLALRSGASSLAR